MPLRFNNPSLDFYILQLAFISNTEKSLRYLHDSYISSIGMLTVNVSGVVIDISGREGKEREGAGRRASE